MRKYSCFLAALAVLIAGCGGGGASEQQPASHPIQLGEATIGYSGSSDVQTYATGGVVSHALAAGGVTNLLMNPVPNAAHLPLIFTQDGSIFLYRDGFVSQVNSSTTGFAYSASFTPAGQIIFVGYDASTMSTNLYTCYEDGSRVAKIPVPTTLDSSTTAKMSPDGLHILYTAGPVNNRATYECSATGAGSIMLQAPAASPSWRFDSAGFTYAAGDIYFRTLTSTKATLIYPAPVDVPTLSPDGKAVALRYKNPDNTSTLQVTDAVGNFTIFGNTTGAPYSISPVQPAFSADSKQLAFVGYDSNGQYLFLSSWNAARPLALFTARSGITSVDLAPYLKPRRFIGTSGLLYSTAAGFLWNQTSNGQFASLLAFTATTPSTSSVTLTNPGGGAPVYKISADALTGLKYQNGYNVPPTAVTVSGKSVLVSVDPTTGQVAFVANMVAGQATSSGSKIQAQFGAVYSANGTRVAESARELDLDAKTGKLISVK